MADTQSFVWWIQFAEQVLTAIAVIWTFLVIIVMRRIRAFHPNLQAILINVQIQFYIIALANGLWFFCWEALIDQAGSFADKKIIDNIC
jgi:hypothetical protein